MIQYWLELTLLDDCYDYYGIYKINFSFTSARFKWTLISKSCPAWISTFRIQNGYKTLTKGLCRKLVRLVQITGIYFSPPSGLSVKRKICFFSRGKSKVVFSIRIFAFKFLKWVFFIASCCYRGFLFNFNIIFFNDYLPSIYMNITKSVL